MQRRRAGKGNDGRKYGGAFNYICGKCFEGKRYILWWIQFGDFPLVHHFKNNVANNFSSHQENLIPHYFLDIHFIRSPLLTLSKMISVTFIKSSRPSSLLPNMPKQRRIFSKFYFLVDSGSFCYCRDPWSTTHPILAPGGAPFVFSLQTQNLRAFQPSSAKTEKMGFRLSFWTTGGTK